jgi:Spx/MgsR family transcriptional regulator
MIHIYGIPNCNSVKKALDFLKKHNATFVFHDFKKEGVTKEQLKHWAESTGWENLMNKKGTTWRALTPEEQSKASLKTGAFDLMQHKTSVIKRPLAEWPGGSVTVGFDEKLFSNSI